MKILLTHELFPPDFAGGGEYVVFETARHLMRQGVDVRVLTTGNPRLNTHDGVAVQRLPIHRYRLNLAVPAIVRAARDVDLIQTFNYHACLPSLVAGLVLRKPVICYVMALFQDAWRQMRGPVAGTAWRTWERFLVTRPFALTIFPSDYCWREALALGVCPDRSFANPPGIDPDMFGPAPSKDHVVLVTGKLDERKGTDDLIAVARALPGVTFRVMGWGPGDDDLRRAALPNVQRRPFTIGAPLRDALAAARIFFSPTKAETFGIGIVQAMASGCAIVSTVPLGYHGALVAPGDVPAMTAAIARLWNDSTE